MAKSENCIEAHVERIGKEGSSVRRVALKIPGGCSIEVSCQDGAVGVRLSMVGIGVCLGTEGPQSDFARAINLLCLHLPRCRI
jgi:hypothetical protein